MIRHFNLADLTMLGELPLRLILTENERQSVTSYIGDKRVDDTYIIIDFETRERAEVVIDALQAMARRKMGRKVRTK